MVKAEDVLLEGLRLAFRGPAQHRPSLPQEGQLSVTLWVRRTQAEVEIKAQLKPRGRVAKAEDSKPFHQLYKLQIKST